MKIIPNNNLRKTYVKRFWRETRRTLVKVRQQVIDMAGNSDPNALKHMTRYLLLSQPMVDQLKRIWSEVGGRYGYETERLIARNRKAVKDPAKLEDWKRKMRVYSAERSLLKAEKILTTEAEAINSVIDSVIQESLDQGLGIEETRQLLVHDLSGERMTVIENWQAERIAMTEVGQANNTGSFMAASEDPEGVKKIWLFIPGKKTFRDNHQGFEALGPKPMDYEFAPGLQFPGDSNASADEVINCYCSIGYSVD